MHTPRGRCGISWCNGPHTETDRLIKHHADVGTTDVDGAPVTVSLLYLEPITGSLGIGPLVMVRWSEPAPDTEDTASPGLDMTGAEALAFGQLLITAHARLAADGCMAKSA